MTTLLDHVPDTTQGSRRRCPLCDSRRALSVDADEGDTGVWHCFSCDAGGDGIAYLMRVEDYSFQDACHELGADYKLTDPGDYDREAWKRQKQREKRRRRKRERERQYHLDRERLRLYLRDDESLREVGNDELYARYLNDQESEPKYTDNGCAERTKLHADTERGAARHA
jgi:DNA primase